MAIKILLGGSPCTHWSIAQKNNRETEPEGLGWELFKNYLIAKKKFNPDLFLYENNKSAAQPIKDQIAKELGVGTDPNARFTYINSALVSAQNRQRFYVTNFGDIEQPEDRGILLKDILENGENLSSNEKSYVLTTPSSIPMAENIASTEPLRIGTIASNIKNKKHDSKQYRVYSPDAKATTLCSSNGSMGKMTGLYATPIYVGEIPNNNGTYLNGSQPSQQYRVYDVDGKGVSVTTTAITNVAIPVSEPIRVGCLPSPDGAIKNTQSMRVYSVDGKSVTQSANGGGLGGKTGLYATPICHTIPQEVRVRKYDCDIDKFQECLRSHKTKSCRAISEALGRPQTEVEHWFRTDKYFNIPDEDIWFDLKKLLNIETNEFDDFVTVFEVREGVFEKADRCYDVNGKMSTLTTGKTDNIIEPTNTTGKTIYEVKDGLITIKDKQYPIKLADGYYIIRKLTPIECERLQTLPDNYTAAVSNAQRYKGVGNGWTAEVIIHLLNHALKDVSRDEEIIVLSMYDGIGTGRYCLDKMGFTNVRYYSYEIDKYAKQVSMSNYPDIIQCGDAFDLRHPDWTIGY